MADPLETETPSEFQSTGFENDDAFNAALREYETATPPEPQAEEPSTEPETLDDLIQTFQTSAKAEDESYGRQELYQHAETLTDAARRIDAERQRIRDEQTRWDLERALGSMEGELGVPAGSMLPHLVGLYRTNPAVAAAWDGRNENPVRWADMHDRIVRSVDEMFRSRYDPNVTEDRMAISHAVKGNSRQSEPAPLPSLGRLSDRELNQLSREWGIGDIV